MALTPEISKKLEEGVAKVFNSTEYKEYLRTSNKFHNYSAYNVLLIMAQKPTATVVAGFNTWKSMDRFVRKGEKAIKIIAPIIHKEKNENNEEVVAYTSYRAVNVFDVSQTEGKELPQPPVTKLADSVADYDKVVERLIEVSPVPVCFDEWTDSANGYYDGKSKDIKIKKGLSEAQTIKTLVHEMAHSFLLAPEAHETNKAPKGDREVQAESVAFQVCDWLGIDTSEYSFGYIAGWSKSKSIKDLLENMTAINKTANRIIKLMEGGIA